MNVAVLLLIALIVLVVEYFTYGTWVGRKLGVNPKRPTPAHTLRDGVDYVPARAPVLLGHHFASIAGAMPIIGPVLAAAYGWAPAFLWILVGVVLIGATHDFATLLVSARHEGQSIGIIIERNIGPVGKRLFLAFSFAALILVIVVFMNAVAGIFASTPAVATSSLLFIGIAIGFGFAVHRRNTPLGMASVVGVLLLALCVAVGLWAPIQLSANSWRWIVMVYIFIASVTPVWILLQPRDYLNSFLLYGLLTGGVVGILLVRTPIELPAVITLNHVKWGPIFPILFVMVACGSVSGFHSLVASGTTAKQLDSEADAKPVGYGGMLIEGLLAVVALCAVATLSAKGYGETVKGKEDAIPAFSRGVAKFMAGFGLPVALGAKLTALAVCAFALTSLDTGTRLARFAFQEFFQGSKSPTGSLLAKNRFVATAVPVVLGTWLAFSGKVSTILPVFGSANQLLAALALLAVAAWLAKRKRKNLFVVIPMCFMFVVTLSALARVAYKNLTAAAPNVALGLIAVLLFVLAILLLVQAIDVLKSPTAQKEAAA